MQGLRRTQHNAVSVAWMLSALVTHLHSHAATGADPLKPQVGIGSRAIPQSIVAFTNPQPADLYQRYGVDMIVWGFTPPVRDKNQTQQWLASVKEVQNAGVKYQARVEFDAGWRLAVEKLPDIEASLVRNLDGGTVEYPWFKGETFKGYPPVWFCSNSSAWRQLLLDEVDYVMAAQPDYLLLDAQTSTALTVMYYGGCFCDSCTRGFRDYLRDHHQAEQLHALGITDIERFNYGEFLRSKGFDARKFTAGTRRGSDSRIPLLDEFGAYQHRAVNELSQIVFEHAKRLRPTILVSSSSPVADPLRNTLLPPLDFFTEEMPQEASGGALPVKPLLSYKICEAMDKPLIVTGQPNEDWRVIRDTGRRQQVRLWIALAYANSACFIAPIAQYCVGPDRFITRPGDYDYLYRFIDEHAALLDGYRPAASVAYVYGGKPDGTVVQDLFRANIPFHLLLAGEVAPEFPMDESRLSAAKAIVVDGSIADLKPEQRRLLERQHAKLVEWPAPEKLNQLTPREITVSFGDERIAVSPRKNEAGGFVCHLINRQYSPEQDAMVTQSDFTVTIATSLCGEAGSVTLHRPEGPEQRLKITKDKSSIGVQVPELELWGILSFKK